MFAQHPKYLHFRRKIFGFFYKTHFKVYVFVCFMINDFKKLVARIQEQELHYIGERYYYSTATETLYRKNGDKKLHPVFEKDSCVKKGESIRISDCLFH